MDSVRRVALFHELLDIPASQSCNWIALEPYPKGFGATLDGGLIRIKLNISIHQADECDARSPVVSGRMRFVNETRFHNTNPANAS